MCGRSRDPGATLHLFVPGLQALFTSMCVVLGICIDIFIEVHARKSLEVVAASRGETTARRLTKALCDEVVILSAGDLTILEPAPKLASLLLRFSSQQLAGISFLELLPIEDQERCQVFFQMLSMADGGDNVIQNPAATLNIVMIDGNNVGVKVQLFACVFLDAQDRLCHLVGICEIGDQKRADTPFELPAPQPPRICTDFRHHVGERPRSDIGSCSGFDGASVSSANSDGRYLDGRISFFFLASSTLVTDCLQTVSLATPAAQLIGYELRTQATKPSRFCAWVHEFAIGTQHVFSVSSAQEFNFKLPASSSKISAICTLQRCDNAALLEMTLESIRISKSITRHSRSSKLAEGNSIYMTHMGSFLHEVVSEAHSELASSLSQDDDEFYCIAVTMPQGSELGIDVEAEPQEHCLRVMKVRDGGLVAAWNDSNVGKDVRAGDRIVMVNNASGSAVALAEKLQAGSDMVIWLRRA